MAKFINKIKKKLIEINENIFVLSDTDNMYMIKSYTDTGCLVLNAVLSDGDIRKGLPDGKRVMLAGPSSSAKSWLITDMIKTYLIQYKDAMCFLFESESATIIEMAHDQNFPTDLLERIIIIPVETVEDVITQFTNVLDEIIEENKKSSTPVKAIGVLDSLGMLSTRAEQASALDGTNKADAGRRNKLIKSLARTITMKISKVGMPFLVANHVYANIGGYGGGSIISGGGVFYMQDIMLILSKSKERDSQKTQIGNNINVKVFKSRFMKEDKKVQINLNFETGMNKFSDIVALGQKYGILVKSGNNYIIDGEEIKMKLVKQNPEKYLSEEILQEIGKAIKDDFSFGKINTEGV